MTPERIAELDRTTIDIQYLNSLRQQDDSVFDLADQERALSAVLVYFGLYDALDIMRYRQMGQMASNPPSVVLPAFADGLKKFPQSQAMTDDQLDAAVLIALRFGLTGAARTIARPSKS